MRPHANHWAGLGGHRQALVTRTAADSGEPGSGQARLIVPAVNDNPQSAGRQTEKAPRTALDGVRVHRRRREEDRGVIGARSKPRRADYARCEFAHAITILQRDDIDVLLADIAMPGGDGYSLIRQIRSEGTYISSIPAAAITAHARDEERTRALAAGFQMHLAKPVEPGEIVRMVDHLAHDRRLNGRLRM